MEHYYINNKPQECYPESDFKFYTKNHVNLNQRLIFRGWECVVFSVTWHVKSHFMSECLLRRELKVVENE